MSERFTKSKLLSKRTHQFVYVVTGDGEFPFDMLRYDAAFPSGPIDADQMTAGRQNRSVKLIGYREPTLGRWASFGWSVSKDFIPC